MNARTLLDRMLKLDRRIIYTLVFIGVIFPFYTAWPPITVEVSREVEDTYRIVDQIPPHSRPLLLSFDYDFLFSVEHKGAVGRFAYFGRLCIMAGFGASFGYTVMARVSLLIGRVQFLTRDFLEALGRVF